MSDFDNARDRVAGSAKETAGKVTGDKDLEAEGSAQNTEGRIRQKLDDASEGLRDAADDAAATARAAARRVKERLSGDDGSPSGDSRPHDL